MRCSQHCVQPLFGADKRPVIAAVFVHSALLPTSQRFAPEPSQRTAQTLCQSQPIASPGVPLGLSAAFSSAGGHKTRPCPQALRRGGTGNICGLKERGRGGGGGVREGTRAGDGQTPHCARPQQMGKAKYAAYFLVERSMKPGTREAKGQIF